MIVCTTAALSHLPYALELAQSVRRHLPGVKLVLGLVEHSIPDSLKSLPWFDRVLLARELPIPDFNQFIFKLTMPLSKNTIKAQLLQHLIQTDEEADVVVYADCFTKFFGPIPEAIQLLEHHSIIVTPHLIDVNHVDSYDPELSLLNDGTFFSGFIAVKRNEETLDFLAWWSDKLNRDIRDPYASNFFDQKWLNFANVFYNTGVLRHPGYQLAFWNFHEKSRQVAAVQDHQIQLQNGPLRLMTFNSEYSSFEQKIQMLSSQQSQVMRLLKENYDANVQSQDLYGLRQAEWSYDRYYNGEAIVPEARHMYRQLSADQAPANPFEWSNEKFQGDGHG